MRTSVHRGVGLSTPYSALRATFSRKGRRSVLRHPPAREATSATSSSASTRWKASSPISPVLAHLDDGAALHGATSRGAARRGRCRCPRRARSGAPPRSKSLYSRRSASAAGPSRAVEHRQRRLDRQLARLGRLALDRVVGQVQQASISGLSVRPWISRVPSTTRRPDLDQVARGEARGQGQGGGQRSPPAHAAQTGSPRRAKGAPHRPRQLDAEKRFFARTRCCSSSPRRSGQG